MKYCKKCLMPNTRPGLEFDKNDVCEACNNFTKQKNVNWDLRFNELKIMR